MPLYLWIDVEKSRETHPELLLNLVLATLENVHRNVRLSPILQFDRSRSDLRDLIGGQQSQTVNQCKVCHPTIVSQRMKRARNSQQEAICAAIKSDCHQNQIVILREAKDLLFRSKRHSGFFVRLR
jgi:hypothetical protein